MLCLYTYVHVIIYVIIYYRYILLYSPTHQDLAAVGYYYNQQAHYRNDCESEKRAHTGRF